MFLCRGHLSSPFGHRFQLVGFVVFTLTLFTRTASVSAGSPDHDEIRKILNENPHITYKLLKHTFENMTKISSDEIPGSRLFPLCINSLTLEKYSPLKDFAPIWNEMSNQFGCEKRPLYFYEYNQSLHSMRSNTEWIEEITLSRINTPEKDVRNMRQWMHIKVKATTSLLALYMQPIVGGIGMLYSYPYSLPLCRPSFTYLQKKTFF